MERKFSIALDGPSGSGKSTVAKLLSKKLDILYLDTGAMYRAVALKALRENLDTLNESDAEKCISDLDLRIKYENGAQKTCLGEEDVSEKIREPQVSMAASNISKHKAVRIKMVEMQREIAKQNSCVLDGRDIGSYVLPDADFKFYITASSAVRAKRRYDELTAKGHVVDLNELQKEIDERDYNDSHRDFSPLVQADDAILVDTSLMSVDVVLDTLLSYINRG